MKTGAGRAKRATRFISQKMPSLKMPGVARRAERSTPEVSCIAKRNRAITRKKCGSAQAATSRTAPINRANRRGFATHAKRGILSERFARPVAGTAVLVKNRTRKTNRVNTVGIVLFVTVHTPSGLRVCAAHFTAKARISG